MSSVSRQFGSSSGVKRNAMPDWELIWENDDPTASFAAQIISLNLAKYGWVKVEVGGSGSNSRDLIRELAVEEDGKGIIFQLINLYQTDTAAGSIYSYSRVMWATPTGLEVSACSRRRLNTTDASANSTQNGNIIPRRIWGKTTASSVGGDASFRDSGAGMRLLWTNPDTSAEFAAQTISLDLSEYDAVRIPILSAAGNVVDTIFADVGGEQSYGQFVTLATNLVARQRGAKATATGVTFTGCASRTQGQSSNATTNNNLIPEKIYGIKFG